MSENKLEVAMEDLVVMKRLSVYIEPLSMCYLVTVTDEDGTELATSYDHELSVAVQICLQEVNHQAAL